MPIRPLESRGSSGESSAANAVPCRRCGSPLDPSTGRCDVCAAGQWWRHRVVPLLISGFGLLVLAGAGAVLFSRGVKLTVRTIPGARVFIDGRETLVSSTEGVFLVRGLKRTDHVLRVTAEGHKPVEKTVEFRSWDFARSIKIDLGNAASEPASKPVKPIPESGAVEASNVLSGMPSLTAGGGELAVWFRDLHDDNIAITMRSRGLVLLHVDVNQDGKIDGRDLTYAAKEDGSICTQYLDPRGGATQCGSYQTRASVRVRRLGSDFLIAWTIPKWELGTSRQSAHVAFETYQNMQSRYYPDRPFNAVYGLEFTRPQSSLPSLPQTKNEKLSVSVPRPPASLPSIQFSSDRPRIVLGETVVLNWRVDNAQSVRLEPQGKSFGPVGQQEERPKVPTVYRLVATNADGVSSESTVPVEVLEPLEIRHFDADRPTARLGESFILSWETTGATEVVIDLVNEPLGSLAKLSMHQGGKGHYSVSVNPGQYTRYGVYEYRLVAKGSLGVREARVKVDLPRP